MKIWWFITSLLKKKSESDQIKRVVPNPIKQDEDMVAFSVSSSKGTRLPKPLVSQRYFSGSRMHKPAGNEVVINRIDGRYEVEGPTNIFPWSIHGHLQIEYSDKIFVGSGIMINLSHVLTAGHCLYASKDGGIPEQVIFYPGRQGDYTPWVLPAKRIIVHPSYHKNEDTDSDLGLLILDDKIGKETGWARLKIFDDTHLLEGLSVDITGYPHDKFVDRLPYMYTMKGPVKVVHHNRFYYDIDTSGGQSGSGVCVTDAAGGDVIDCLGIHTTGSKVEGNGATRINSEKFKKIEKWVTSFPEATA